jgi:hypothetical protein
MIAAGPVARLGSQLFLTLIYPMVGPDFRAAGRFAPSAGLCARRPAAQPQRRINRSGASCSLPFGWPLGTSCRSGAEPFHRVDPMNYRAFNNDSLTMMYESVRAALASDDAQAGMGEERRFRIRETPDWRKHAADLEAEMLKRGMFFEVIDWSEDQATLPFDR